MSSSLVKARITYLFSDIFMRNSPVIKIEHLTLKLSYFDTNMTLHI